MSDDSTAFDYDELSKLEWGESRADLSGNIANLLTKAPIAVDELIRQSGAGAAQVHMALLELEISGEIEREGTGMVRRGA